MRLLGGSDFARKVKAGVLIDCAHNASGTYALRLESWTEVNLENALKNLFEVKLRLLENSAPKKERKSTKIPR